MRSFLVLRLVKLAQLISPSIRVSRQLEAVTGILTMDQILSTGNWETNL